MKTLKLFLVAVFFFPTLVLAQYGSVGVVDARSMGLAKTYNNTATGVYSIGLNPANLMKMPDKRFEFTTVLPIPQINVKAGTNFLTIDDLNYYFGGVDGKARVLTEEDKKNLNSLFDGGGKIFMDANIGLLSVAYKYSPTVGAFSFAINDFVGSNLVIPQALPNLALTGNEMDKVYSLAGADGDAWYLRAYSLSYARDLPEIPQTFFDKISTGISLKFIKGYAYAGIERVNSNIMLTSNSEVIGKQDILAYTAFSPDFGIDYDFDSTDSDESSVGPFPESVGSGVGFDIGFSAEKGPWMFSFAITDIAFSKIKWNKHTAQYSALNDLYVNEFTNEEQLDTLSERVKAKGEKIAEFTTGLPTALRLGAAYMFNSSDDAIPGTLLLAIDYNQGFNYLPGNSKIGRFSIGAEWKPGNWIPYVRTGISMGGIDGFNWAFGLGFDAGIVEFHFSTTDMQSFVAPNAANQISVAFGSRWKIN